MDTITMVVVNYTKYGIYVAVVTFVMTHCMNIFTSFVIATYF